MLQSARTDAVRALLVLLHLLEAKIERIGQLLLADAEHHPPHAHPAANVHVNGVWGLDGGHWLSPSTKELLCRNGPAFGDEAAGQRQLSALESMKSNVVFVAKSAGMEAPPALRTRPPALDAMQLSYLLGGLFAQL